MGKAISRDDRSLSLILSALLVFLIVYSSPHLVHHAFGGDLQASCLALSIAKSCHLKPVSAVKLVFIQVVNEIAPSSFEARLPLHITLALFKRAPPTFLST